jgi:hypothetical protein
MESTIPWNDVYAFICPRLILALYQVRTDAVYGNSDAAYPSPPAMVHAFQSLSGEMLIGTLCFRRFAEIDLIDGQIPDVATILIFKHFLEEHQIAEELLDYVIQSLSNIVYSSNRGRSLMRRSSTLPAQQRTSRKRVMQRYILWQRATTGTLEGFTTAPSPKPRTTASMPIESCFIL